jgi:hypothetical protein
MPLSPLPEDFAGRPGLTYRLDVRRASASLPAGKTIELVNQGSSEFKGHASLIENAMRNLIDDAIRHSGP